MPIRKSVYWTAGQPISLAYLECIGDDHPELVADKVPAPEPQPAPLYYPGEKRSPSWTAGRIRRALGKDQAHSERLLDKIRFQATLSRIMREGY